MPLNIKEVMESMPGAFLPEKAGDQDVTIQFHMAGEQAGDWFATIKDGVCEINEGTKDNPTMALSADGEDYINVVTGKLDGMQAFMQGKLKIKGDMNLAMKMTSFFNLG
ncbi:MAG: SCP2 sterol-binding domain-containing protein [Chloroflexota bacterium]